METKTIFRKFKQGDIIALFPQIPADNNGFLCMSYQHIGQHGAADPALVYNTDLAAPEEYDALLQELTAIGYEVKVASRFTRKDFDIRKQTVYKGY